MMRNIFAQNESQLEQFERKLSRIERSSRYQAAAEHLAAARGMDELNRLIRSAVLRALHPEWESKVVPNIQPEALKRLEKEFEIWKLNPGIEALGKLICARRDLFSGPILTTNFDPLIEVSLWRAGCSPASIVLAQDGSPQQYEPGSDVPVVHLHGLWRGSGDTLHTAAQLENPRPKLKRWLGQVLHDHVVLVLGYGGWQDVFTRTLLELAAEQSIEQVFWCLHEKEDEIPVEKDRKVIGPFKGLSRVVWVAGVDAQELLPRLWEVFASEPSTDREPAIMRDRRSGDGPVTVRGSGPRTQGAPASRSLPGRPWGGRRFGGVMSPDTDRGRSLAILAAVCGMLVVFALWGWLDHPFAEDHLRVNIFVDDRPVHLGDNIFQTLLVPDPAQVPDPVAQSRSDLIHFNKATLQFEAISLSAGQAALLEWLSKAFSPLDFSSYRHVRLVEEDEVRRLGLEPVPSPRVAPVGRGGFLIWAREQGNYHQSRAAVLVSHRLDLVSRVREALSLPGEFEVTRVVLAVELSHGGNPSGQGGEFLVVVNGKILHLSSQFRHREGQQRETLEVDVTSSVHLAPGLGVTELSLVTMPIQEATPVPGPEDPDPLARPVHFREVMISRVALRVDARVQP